MNFLTIATELCTFTTSIEWLLLVLMFSGDRAKETLLEILKGLEYFALGIHNEWTHPRYRFANGLTAENKNIHLRAT